MQFTFFNWNDSLALTLLAGLDLNPNQKANREKKTPQPNREKDGSHLFLHSISLIGSRCHVIAHENNALKRDSSTLINPP